MTPLPFINKLTAGVSQYLSVLIVDNDSDNELDSDDKNIGKWLNEISPL